MLNQKDIFDAHTSFAKKWMPKNDCFSMRIAKVGLGNDISVTSKLLGHSNLQTTAGFYIHHDLGIKRAAVDMLERHI